MELKITPSTRRVWTETLGKLAGQARRLFMASVVQSMGRGGAAWAKRELGWDRTTIAKGMKELDCGEAAIDRFHLRGRKGFSAKLPQLKDDLRAIGERSSQTDPTFRTTQLYRRLTASEARRQLIEKGYSEQEIPSERSLSRMLNQLGFKPRRVAKSKPLRKLPQTDAIFDKVHETNKQADVDSGTIRLSIDTKTPVPIGDFSRGGKSRNGHKALDHDFQPEAKLTPFGIHRPDTGETWLSFTTGSATADFMVDRLTEIWPTIKKQLSSTYPRYQRRQRTGKQRRSHPVAQALD